MRKYLLLLLAALFVVFKSEAQLSESFDGTTFPPAGWTVTGSGISDNGGPVVWVRTPNGGFGFTPNPNTHTGAGMAGYNAWDIALGGTSYMVSPSLNFTTGGTRILSFWVYQIADLANDSLIVFVNTSPAAGGTRLAAFQPSWTPSQTGWVNYVLTIPNTYNGANNYIIFEGYSWYRDDIFVDDINVYTQTPLAPTVTNNGPVCPGSTLTITAAPLPSFYPTPTYTLTGPGIATPVTNSTGIFTISNVTSTNNGTYSITASSNGYTSAAGTTSVTIYTVPTLATGTVTNPATCGGPASIQLTGLAASATYTLQYRKNITQQAPSSITSNSSGNYTISNLTPGVYDSIRVITSNGCYSNMLGSITILDPSRPSIPNLTYSNPLCNGTTLTLTIASSGTAYSSGTTYTFGGPGGYSVSGTSNTATRPNITTSLTGNYIAYVISGGCQSAITNVTVSITPASAAPVPNNVSYCQGETAVALTAQGTNLLWYTSATGGTGSSTAPTPSTAVATTLTYYVSQSAPCEGPRAALTVTVKPTPAPPIVTSPMSVCQYEVLQPLTAQGSNLLWYTTLTGGSGTVAAPTPVTTVPGTYNFYVSQTINGCEGPRSIIAVTVKPKPAPPVVVSPANLCQYDPPSPLSAQGQNLRWYTTPTGGVGLTTAPIPNTGYEDSFYYYVSQTVNGCESDRSQMKIVVNYLPNGIIERSRPWTCQEDTISFFYFGNARPDAIYNWKSPSPQTSYVSGGGQGPYVVRFNTVGQQVISVQINNKGCLSTIIAQPVSVRELPVVSFVSSRQDACLDQVVNVALNHISSNIQNYDWQGFDGANIAYGTATGGPYGVSWSTAGTHVISVLATSNECTSHPVYDTIGIHEYPDAKIDYGNKSLDICSGDSLILKVPVGMDPAIYKWGPKFYFYNTGDSSAEVIARPRFSGAITVKVTSIYGCEGQDSILVNARPCCGVVFPSAFTPNNDSRNDVFRPITSGHHDVKTFRIINRWGQVVYESQDETKGWDGTFNGVPQDMGTYYYYYHYKCVDGQDLEEKGELLLMR